MPQPPLALFFSVALATLLALSAAVFALDIPNGVYYALLLYVGSLIVAALTASNAQRRHGERLSLYLLILIAASGPFGAGIAFVAGLIYSRSEHSTTNISEWISSLFDTNETRESDLLHERISFGLDDFESAAGVEPFRDILSGGGVLQKQMAIAKIARYFRPAFAPLLLQAARDSNAAVRVQAATALAKIERDFMARYIKLENDLRDLADHDPAKLKLAELYDDYAHADLLDDNNRHELRQKSIRIYAACLALQENPEWRLKLGRLYLRENLPDETIRMLQPLIDAPESPRNAMLWYMEALFRLKKFGDLRQLAANQLPLVRLSDSASPSEIESLPAVWEGSAIWEGKSLPRYMGGRNVA